MKSAEALEITGAHASDEMLQDRRREGGHADRRKNEEGPLSTHDKARAASPRRSGKARPGEPKPEKRDGNQPDPSFAEHGDVLEEARHEAGQMPHGRSDRTIEKKAATSTRSIASREGAAAGQEIARRRYRGP